MTTQTDLFAAPAGPVQLPHNLTQADLAEFRARLISAGTWQTRADLCKALNWDERKVREVAEALGPEVVRCQLGFKLTEMVTRDDLSCVKQAIDAFHSQAAKMEAYAQSLRRRLHALVG